MSKHFIFHSVMANIVYDKPRCRVIDLSAHPVGMMEAIDTISIDSVTHGGHDGQLFKRIGVSAMLKRATPSEYRSEQKFLLSNLSSRGHPSQPPCTLYKSQATPLLKKRGISVAASTGDLQPALPEHICTPF
ncbi:hypothetical protein GGI35DRAFT_459418 [Trichoderma velutinum]